jgi:hypothetical protein
VTEGAVFKLYVNGHPGAAEYREVFRIASRRPWIVRLCVWIVGTWIVSTDPYAAVWCRFRERDLA